MRRIGRAIVAAGLCTTLAVASAANATSTAAEGTGPDPRPDDGDVAASRLAADSDPALQVDRNGRGVAEFVATRTGNGIDNPARRDNLGPAASAEAHIDRYGAMFGLRKGSSTEVVDSRGSGSGGSVVRLQQSVNGLPVIGGELVVNQDAEGDLTSVLAETTQAAAPATATAVSEASARATAIEVTAKHRGSDAATLRAEPGTKWLYDPAIVGAQDILGARPVWRFEVSNGSDVREFVLVDSDSGRIALHFNQIAHDLNRGICDNENVRQDDFVTCGSGFARSEGGPPSVNTDVNDAYDLSKVTSDFYSSVDGVDLTDLIGVVGPDSVKRLTSTVNWCFTQDTTPGAPEELCPMDNAFWNGTQMYYGQDYAVDDIVGHELTHGYTEKTSNLLYYFQSGAINESMSDVIGEIVDHRTIRQQADNAWRIGEDLPGGAFRNMRNPSQFGDPGRMRSPNYETDINGFDNGGVHFNSGVGNKTAFLISQGGSFNGQRINGIDGADRSLNKTAHLYLDVIAALTSGSDYADLGRVLSSTCNGYVAARRLGFTAANCANVRKAVLATELAQQPVDPDAQATEARAGCPAGTFKKWLYTDNVDTSGKTWTKGALWSTSPNAEVPENATSGTKAYHGANPDPSEGGPATSALISANSVAIPRGQKSYLHFKHWYLFEFNATPREYYDGGFVSVRKAGAAKWRGTAAMRWVNGPDRPIRLNAPPAQQGFGGLSAGYQSSRLDLAAMAGKRMQMRFQVKGDASIGYNGWFLDDISVYTCPPVPAAPRNLVARGGLGEVKVTWRPPARAGRVVAGYRITSSDGSVRRVPASARRSTFAARPGRSYRFRVRAVNHVGIAGKISRATATATTTRLWASDRRVRSGDLVRLSGALLRAGTSSGLTGKVVALQRRTPGTARWATFSRARTGSGGSYAKQLRPSRTFDYRATFGGANGFIGDRSRTVRIRVR